MYHCRTPIVTIRPGSADDKLHSSQILYQLQLINQPSALAFPPTTSTTAKMMFTRFTSFVSVASLAALAAATPAQKRWDTPTPTVTITVTATPPAATPPASSCSTGPIQCCNSVSQATDPVTSTLLGLLGVVVEGIDAIIGVQCSPISVVGIGNNQCSSNAVCCQNNNVGGLLSIGCLPVIL
ncbi:fungal hydrophobin-domain-containing protein [Cubamyces menziesii]|nr:fungal hydrophobin-domain-containing protein [Cubamyces menziesii]